MSQGRGLRCRKVNRQSHQIIQEPPKRRHHLRQPDRLFTNYIAWFFILFLFVVLSRFPNAKAQLPDNQNGIDFSNNLFTDIAPLLSLFGEDVTKQFLSQSMYWSDDIIFAMCPLGIVTGIACAIRAMGPPWLKALIGRARETASTVEVELLSSTSDQICELYADEGIIRVPGSPLISPLLLVVIV